VFRRVSRITDTRHRVHGDTEVGVDGRGPLPAAVFLAGIAGEPVRVRQAALRSRLLVPVAGLLGEGQGGQELVAARQNR
jgi:hypothetical protein